MQQKSKEAQKTPSTKMASIIKYIIQLSTSPNFPIILALGLSLLVILKRVQKKSPRYPSLPVVPGFPLVGNLLQFKDKKPYKTFTRWAEVYGPIYYVKAGATSMVVLNTTDVAKEALVTKFSSISTRKLSNAMNVLSSYKCMVAMSDYNDFHKRTKRCLISGFLSANSQKKFRCHRNRMVSDMMQKLKTWIKENRHEAVNIKYVVQNELFKLVLKQCFGKDINSLHVEDLGTTLSRDEIFAALVVDPMEGALDVDWRDFFPYLKWVPNKSLEAKIEQMNTRRNAVMKALLAEQKKRISAGETVDCFTDFLLSEQTSLSLTDNDVCMLIWEPVIQSADTTLVTTEWALYELGKNTECQDRLHREIQSVCGFNKITEEDLPKLPYLNAVFHETIRKYSPVPILPPRYAHEDTELGGYHIPAGSQIAINIYGCNMDKNQWDEPEKWKPERFITSKYDVVDVHKTLGFGGGKRVCAGSQQAITITCMTIGTFAQEFQWSLGEGQEEDVDTVILTTHKLRPLQVLVTPRNYN